MYVLCLIYCTLTVMETREKKIVRENTFRVLYCIYWEKKSHVYADPCSLRVNYTHLTICPAEVMLFYITCNKTKKLYLCCSHWWPSLSCPKRKYNINMWHSSSILMAQRLNDISWPLITAYGDAQCSSKKSHGNMHVIYSKLKFKIVTALMCKPPSNKLFKLFLPNIFKDCWNWPIIL